MRPDAILVCKAEVFQRSNEIADIESRVREICNPLREKVKPKYSIAIAVGSRGIANIAKITKEVVLCLQRIGAVPFIIPAMGSHGGATADGQAELLAEYGITAERMGADICSSMETLYIGDADCSEKLPVYVDKYALEADGVIVINRVKPHTDFHGTHESGIVKMLVIGLGKHKQAILMHSFGADGLRDLIPLAAKKVLQKVNVIGAVGIVEDGFDKTSDIVFASKDEIFEKDGILLEESRKLIAKLPFEVIDTLIIDNMGKNISGTGMDTNVIGRMRIKGQADSAPDCKRIAVLNLSEASHGNATGIGLADVTTKRLFDSIDWRVTNENIITSGFLERGFLPVVAEHDEQAVDIATRGRYSSEEIRLVRIKNTLELGEIYLTKPLMEQLVENKKGVQKGEYRPLKFIDGVISEF